MKCKGDNWCYLHLFCLFSARVAFEEKKEKPSARALSRGGAHPTDILCGEEAKGEY